MGLVTIVLGEYFSFPDNFKKAFNDGENELKSILQISLAPNKFHKLNFSCEAVSYTAPKVVGIKRGKKIEERSVQELIGYKTLDNTKGKEIDSEFKGFIDSDRYETTI